ncbi:GH116 family glycosyl hydrolase [Maliponia aquimaris]|uniref:Glucosylceramidase n=1 Tax=Maliponia aquimaris TaxID=1673631 RepID=A0A238KUM4_9RHOB|nr:GH116 family glycosyl hydrolase [Maliponia aquimaris]SMX46291.1 hypothetical protein MAA8898_03396 [Maliponia aquimaris]
MRRNDPFSAPRSALCRDGGDLPLSAPKWDVLLHPVRETGVPLGGIGTGGIMRSSSGAFSRWTIKAGDVKHFTLPAAGFLLRAQQDGDRPEARALQPDPGTGEMTSLDFVPAEAWQGLFPKAWHRHAPVAGVRADCLSFSPIVPGDLATASLPVALFRWKLTNEADRSADAALAFTFPNLNGWFRSFGEDRPRRTATGGFNTPFEGREAFGVVLDQAQAGEERGEGQGQWAIACRPEPGVALSRSVCFDGYGDGAAFWSPFVKEGSAPPLDQSWVVEGGFRENRPGLATGAVAASVRLAPGESAVLTFALVWDLPAISFGQGRRWWRGYTDQWGRSGTSAAAIADHALGHATEWEARIDAWHGEAEASVGDAPHRAGQAINELYFLVDGMTVLTSATGAPDDRRHFGLIECHDYALYNTLDLWIYAAEAVGRHFPELAAMVTEDFAALTLASDPRLRRHRWHHGLFPINAPGCCPHDVGGPGEDPFVVPNSYTYRDPNLWKDLNCDLVLCIFREGRAMGRDWRVRLFPAVRVAIDRLQRFDIDGDGLIENDGTPDQTFDNIPMKGVSSYCGGLWIAALLAGADLAREAGEKGLSRRWRDQARDAGAVYARLLFNGEYFRVDTQGPLSSACFIEQLFGPFLARRLGLGDIVPAEMARTALSSVFRRNFIEAGGGEGAVSLSAIPASARDALPHKADSSFQTSEIQPGFNYSFAAQLGTWGLGDEADTLYRALHHQLHVRRNLVFQTPAAYDRDRLSCRAILNMRPLSAWWMLPPGA